MGYSGYSHNNAVTRSVAHQSRSTNEVFSQREIHPMMNPHGVTLRESRDSEIHPNSVPIIMALDETGSMDFVPSYLVKNGLPTIMSNIMEHGIADPQIMFMGIGDHITDQAPLQISQFESGDAELDMWLTRVWLEGRGGGNRGESYGLAHFFANNFVQTDAWDKRKEKGFLFTIGDERYHENIGANELRSIMGNNELGDSNTTQEIEKAKEKWHVFHILPGMESDSSIEQWKKVLGENVIFVQDYTQIPQVISDIITKFPRLAPANNDIEAESTSSEQADYHEDDTHHQALPPKKHK